jgi:hypothetical protein
MIRSITYANLNNWNYLDYAGTASIDIIRIGSDITVSWDGSVIVSGVTGDPISKVVIAFMYYPFYGDSFFGTESIDLVKIEGTPIPITVNPYRNEYVIMVGTEYDQSSGKLLYIPINKDGTFGSVSEVADIGYRAGAGIADFDNDGDLDFVAGAREDSLPVANFYLFENIGNGNFVKRLIASNIPCPERVATFAVADFNEDGFKDFVAPINLSEDIYLFTNNGDNTYAWSKLTPLSTGEAKEGDFNGDGHMDFVITDYFNAEVYLYQGDGNGGFTKKFLFDVAGNYQAEEITSGDFNGDGHLDIIVDDFVPHGGGAYLYTGNIENGTLEFVYQGPVFSRPLLVGSTYYGNVYGVDSQPMNTLLSDWCLLCEAKETEHSGPRNQSQRLLSTRWAVYFLSHPLRFRET